MSTHAATRFLSAGGWLFGAALASLIAVGCGGGSGTPAGNGPPGGNPPASGPDVGLASKASLGNYLVASNGRTLYYFGLDSPAAAAQAAVSNCTAADGCLGLWPIFHVSAPTLAAGLQASDFAEFTRPDGAKQSTFRGWPLYFYAGDAKAGDTNGDDFEAWYVIRDPFYSLLVATKSPTGVSVYLADPAGRSIYVFADDTVGTASVAPVSACTGACLSTWTIFLASGGVTPTGVDAAKLTSFQRPDGQMQSAFEGRPLYQYVNDTHPGDTNGEGFMGLWHTLDASGTPN